MDNSLPLLPEEEKTEEPPRGANDIAPPGAEALLLVWLAALPNVVIDGADRVLVLTWVGKGLTQAQLAEAHRRAAARRESDEDVRPIYAKFLARFVDEVLAGASDDAAPSASTPAPWWESDSGISEQGRRMRVDRRGPNETTPDYLIRVAQASGRGPWIEHVLKRWQGTARYQSVIEFFGDQLLPVDFYAS